jgi:hypothetical protein
MWEITQLVAIVAVWNRQEVTVFLDLAKSIALRSRTNERLRYWGRVLAAVFVVIGGLDIVSTNAALAAGQFEGNPLIRWLQADMGPWWSLPKMAFHLLLAYLILWIPSKRMLATGSLVSAAYLLLLANNFYLAGWLL